VTPIRKEPNWKKTIYFRSFLFLEFLHHSEKTILNLMQRFNHVLLFLSLGNLSASELQPLQCCFVISKKYYDYLFIYSLICIFVF
jgi:hypothetical protein